MQRVRAANRWLIALVVVLAAFVAGLHLGYSVHPTKVLYYEAKQANQEAIEKALRTMRDHYYRGHGPVDRHRDD
jgi:hypothetical protein